MTRCSLGPCPGREHDDTASHGSTPALVREAAGWMPCRGCVASLVGRPRMAAAGTARPTNPRASPQAVAGGDGDQEEDEVAVPRHDSGCDAADTCSPTVSESLTSACTTDAGTPMMDGFP